jgi:RNA polymerase subunit RPABC4/transcription elongation factor Spt4
MMDLLTAKICLDCDLLFTAGQTCPRCNSPVWHWLSQWIVPIKDRKELTNARG